MSGSITVKQMTVNRPESQDRSSADETYAYCRRTANLPEKSESLTDSAASLAAVEHM